MTFASNCLVALTTVTAPNQWTANVTTVTKAIFATNPNVAKDATKRRDFAINQESAGAKLVGQGQDAKLVYLILDVSMVFATNLGNANAILDLWECFAIELQTKLQPNTIIHILLLNLHLPLKLNPLLLQGRHITLRVSKLTKMWDLKVFRQYL